MLEGSFRYLLSIHLDEFSYCGGLIVGDNVVRDGKVADAGCTDANVHGVRTFVERLGLEKRLISTALQTVGAKGYDGFTLSFVLAG